jgi:hypothetical protein
LSESRIEALFYIVLIAVPVLGILFLDLNIFKLGNLLFSTIVSMSVIHFIVSQFFQGQHYVPNLPFSSTFLYQNNCNTI